MRFTRKLVIIFPLVATSVSNAIELKPETLHAWDAYVCMVKERMEKRAGGHAPFLWVDEKPAHLQRVRAGEIIVEPGDGGSPLSVERGLIHYWLGAAFVPGAKLAEVMSVLDDYERYKDVYPTLVAKASLLGQTYGHESVRLVMMQKAFSVIGAVETDNEVQVVRLGADRAYSLSASVRVHEIADFGRPQERILPEGHGPGYVWRTFSVTRLDQRDGGVYVEMEMVGLSRSIPLAFRWLVQPLAERLPRNILVISLQDTQDAAKQEIKANARTMPQANRPPAGTAASQTTKATNAGLSTFDWVGPPPADEHGKEERRAW